MTFKEAMKQCRKVGTAHASGDALRVTIPGLTEWSGYPDPCDPDNYWIDDGTGERVSATTGERSEHECPESDDGL